MTKGNLDRNGHDFCPLISSRQDAFIFEPRRPANISIARRDATPRCQGYTARAAAGERECGWRTSAKSSRGQGYRCPTALISPTACSPRKRIRMPSVTPIRWSRPIFPGYCSTGAYAYKVKKPVRLSFLDYSTLAQRRACCDEEVRLNGRYAPDLYLGVSTVGGPRRQPRIDGARDTIEYAVQDAAVRPARRTRHAGASRSDASTAEELTALGRAVARSTRWPRRSDPCEHVRQRPRLADRITLDNFEELRRLPEAAQRRVPGDSSSGSPANTSAARAAAGATRLGPVRDAHGDLHCGNVVRWDRPLHSLRRNRVRPGTALHRRRERRRVPDDGSFGPVPRRPAPRLLQAWAELGDFAGPAACCPLRTTGHSSAQGRRAARTAASVGHPRDRADDCETDVRYLELGQARATQPPAAVPHC